MGEDTYKCGVAPLHAGLRWPKTAWREVEGGRPVGTHSVTFVSDSVFVCVRSWRTIYSLLLPPFFLSSLMHASSSPSSSLFTWPKTSDLFCVSYKIPCPTGVEDSFRVGVVGSPPPQLECPHLNEYSSFNTSASWAQLAHLNSSSLSFHDIWSQNITN